MVYFSKSMPQPANYFAGCGIVGVRYKPLKICIFGWDFKNIRVSGMKTA